MSTGQMFYGFRYSSDRCATPDVGACKYYLGLVPHGSFAQHRDLGSGLFLQTFDGVALRSQNLPHEVELTGTEKSGKSRLAVEARATLSSPSCCRRASLKKVASSVAPDATKSESEAASQDATDQTTASY